MTREEALNLLKKELKSENLIKHSLAVEVGMRKLARYFKEDEEKWGICGLLHDIDYEKTKNAPELHSKIGSQMLKELGFEKEICDAILSHNERHQILPKSLMAKALFCLDPLTGLIVASALVLPSKRLKDLKVENVLNRFREKSFAKGAKREIIQKCKEYLNLELQKFVEIVLEGMKEIAPLIGL